MNLEQQNTPSKYSSPKIFTITAAVIGGVIGGGLVRGLSFDRAVRFASGAFFGTLVGLIPFSIGRKRGYEKLGDIALLSCGISGLLFGLLLAAPVALVFSVVLLRKPIISKQQ